MRRRLARPGRAALVSLVVCVLVTTTGRADEGFWPFNRVPRSAIKRALGVDLSDAWLSRVQHAVVRLPDGTGAFVSPDGLVLTNHHVALSTLQELSSPSRDLVADGFLARTRSQELRVPDLQLLSLDRIQDVTARVNAAVSAGMPSDEALAARRAAIADIEAEAARSTGLQAEVVTLYQGAQYHLYLYRRHTDVRLVFAPEFDAAFFGGDPDNFTFPRYCLDMTVFRVYDADRPLRVAHYLPWAADGLTAGEPVFAAGHPGSTQRLNTVAHLEVLRDHSLPLSLDIYGRLHDAIATYGRSSPEAARQSKDLVFSLENSLKSWSGQLAGLRRPSLMQRKIASEKALRSAVAADPGLSTRFGDAWERIEAARRPLSSYNVERAFFESGLGFFTEYFTAARTLVRWADESQKPNRRRLPEFTDVRKPQIERQLRSPAPVHAALEVARLTASLTVMAERLGTSHALVRHVLAGKTPRARAEELVAGTTLGSASARMALFDGGAAAIARATDPFLALARLVEPRARELRARYDNQVLAVERDAYAKIAQARFAVEGNTAYPDGTFTLRLSYGEVRGYREGGAEVPPFTEIRGLFARGDAHGLTPPYRVANRWMRARRALAMTTPLNVVTTNDIVGGNSGSPLINVRGELVGLVFDGNIHSLPGYFAYEPEINRAISVDVRGMREALAAVYQADALLGELTGAGAGARR